MQLESRFSFEPTVIARATLCRERGRIGCPEPCRERIVSVGGWVYGADGRIVELSDGSLSHGARAGAVKEALAADGHTLPKARNVVSRA